LLGSGGCAPLQGLLLHGLPHALQHQRGVARPGVAQVSDVVHLAWVGREKMLAKKMLAKKNQCEYDTNLPPG